MTKPDFTPDVHSMKMEISRLERQLESAKNLFAQFYQVLGAHDANENVLDAALAASDGNFDFELCPYMAEVNVDDLQEQLAKANERVKELKKELVNRHNHIQELRQDSGEYAILIANLVRRADVKTDLLQNPTFEKASEQLNKFAIEKKIEALDDIRCHWLAKGSEIPLGLECRSKGSSCYNWAMYYAQELAHEIEQLRKEQGSE